MQNKYAVGRDLRQLLAANDDDFAGHRAARVWTR